MSSLAWLGATLPSWFLMLSPLSFYLIEALGQSVVLSLLLILIAALWSAIPYFIAGYVGARWLRNFNAVGSPFLIALVFALVTGFWPVPFPGGLYLPLYRMSWFYQWAEWGGPFALHFWIFFINGLLGKFAYELAVERKFNWQSGVGLLVSFSVMLSVGLWRQKHFERIEDTAFKEGKILRAGLIQPAFPPEQFDPSRMPFPEDYTHRDLLLIPLSNAMMAQNEDLDLIIWPEIPLSMNYLSNERTQGMVDSWFARNKVRLLFCSTERNMPGEEEGRKNEENIVAHFLKASPQQADYRAKKRLIPFSEYLPFEDSMPFLRTWFPRVNRFESDDAFEVFSLDEHTKLAPLICYDDMFTSVAKRWRENGANVLVTMSNDSWFGDTVMQDIRLAAGMLNVMETRLPWLRVGNAGRTLAVLPSGRMMGDGLVPLFRRGFLAVEVPVP